MSFEIILSILVVIIVGLLILFRNNTYVKKYWRYSLILAPAIILLILKIMVTIRQKKVDDTVKSDPLKEHITDIKSKLEEVNTVVKIEAAVAKEKNDTKIAELKEVQKITDDQERRKRLAAMIG
jgi:hypothetical protein